MLHYPPEVVDVLEPFMILGHQGMVEDVFLEDMKARGAEVTRSSPFVNYSLLPDHSVKVEYNNLRTGRKEAMQSQFLVGCDGAHSKVRIAMPDVEMKGEPAKAAWGVLDGELCPGLFVELVLT